MSGSLTNSFFAGLLARTPAINGLRVQLVFKDDAPPRQAMTELFSCESAGALVIDEFERNLATAAQEAGRLSKKHQRIVVWLQAKPNLPFQLGRLAAYLKAIEPINDTLTAGLRAKTRAKRDAAITDLFQEFVSTEAKEAIADWQLNLAEGFCTTDGFPVLEINLEFDGEPIASYQLDGFSGYLRRGSRWITDQPASPTMFRQALLEDIDAYVDQVTAPAAAVG